MTRPRRIYIAGPITAGCLLENIKRATDAFMELLRRGQAPFCPHWSCYAGGPKLSPFGTVYALAERLPAGTDHADWIGVDLPWVEVADAVLRLPGESAGADAECRYANARGIPVLSTVDQVASWAAQRETAGA